MSRFASRVAFVNVLLCSCCNIRISFKTYAGGAVQEELGLSDLGCIICLIFF
jgi:hypothetical protein